MIRRRHVFYVEGYDPQGADGYYRLFRRELKRFLTVWPVKARLGELEIVDDETARWTIEAAGPNWQVDVRYEFLRLEGVLRANLARPIISQVLRAAWWMVDDLVTGTLLRVLRASWRFELHLIWVQLLLLAWIATAFGGGVLAWWAGAHVADAPALAALPIAVAAGIAVFAALRPLANRWFVVQLNNCWPSLRDLGRGRPSGFDRPIEAFAERIVAAARANEADEIVIIGHSGGGVFGPAVLARALALDPDLGRRGPRVVLLTLGSIMPGVALHPAATATREAIRRIATEPGVLWIDCQSRKDVMNFWDFDPVAGAGVVVGPERCNPLVWIIRVRDMVSPERYERLRWNFFRMHYQFIMANDRRAPYDYFMLVCGPAPVPDWAKARPSPLAALGEDASYRPADASVAA